MKYSTLLTGLGNLFSKLLLCRYSDKVRWCKHWRKELYASVLVLAQGQCPNKNAPGFSSGILREKPHSRLMKGVRVWEWNGGGSHTSSDLHRHQAHVVHRYICREKSIHISNTFLKDWFILLWNYHSYFMNCCLLHSMHKVIYMNTHTYKIILDKLSSWKVYFSWSLATKKSIFLNGRQWRTCYHVSQPWKSLPNKLLLL